MDHPEDVAQHVERRDQAELQSVVDHHVDEQDVARVLVEEAGIREDRRLKGVPGLGEETSPPRHRLVGVEVAPGGTCAAGRCRPCCC